MPRDIESAEFVTPLASLTTLLRLVHRVLAAQTLAGDLQNALQQSVTEVLESIRVVADFPEAAKAFKGMSQHIDTNDVAMDDAVFVSPGDDGTWVSVWLWVPYA